MTQSNQYFLDILRTGEIGPISIGMTLDEIIDIFGVPYGAKTIEAFRANDLPRVISHSEGSGVFQIEYDDLQLIFDLDETLQTPYVEGHQPDYLSLPSPIPSDWLYQTFTMSRKSFWDLTQKNGIKCKRWVMKHAELNNLVLHLWLPASSAGVVFTMENGEDRIYTLNLSHKKQNIDPAIWTDWDGSDRQ